MIKINQPELGQKLRKARRLQDIIQRKMGLDIDVSAPYISYIEKGQVFPSEQIVEKICNYLNVDIDTLESKE